MLDKTYYLTIIIRDDLLLPVILYRKPVLLLDILPTFAPRNTVPAWTILLFKYQLCIVYCCAGLSKLTRLVIDAMHSDLAACKIVHPLIGPLLRYSDGLFLRLGGPYSICRCFLTAGRQRGGSAMSVIVFHLLTAVLFQIGIFPG